MRLLIITQKVDESDNNLGFFVRWIKEFAKHVQRVTVICLEEGEHHLPANVSIFSLGKEKITPAGQHRNSGRLHRGFAKALYACRLVRYIVLLRGQYDAVFVHMNPEYLLLGGPLWRFFRKQIGFWYTHQSERFLRSALFFVDHVFTPSQDSFPLRTKKTRIVGHGVDTELFVPRARNTLTHLEDGRRPPPLILSDTRLTPSKRVEQTLLLSETLQKRGVVHTIQIIGAAITEQDRKYEKRLHEQVQERHLPVSFIGGVPFRLVPDYYGQADIFVNHANVGALNKTVLQAMAMNLPVVTSNESYRGILPDAEIVSEDSAVFAERIQAHLSTPSAVSYRERIIREHSLQSLIPKILQYYA